MKKFLGLILPLLSLLVSAEDYDIALSKKTFGELTEKNDLMLVEFYAPWCGHCKALAPEYKVAAEQLHNEHGITLGKVDCTEEKDLCLEQNIKGYPTLKVFRNGEPSEYNGPRKADGIVSYMKKLHLPVVSELSKDKLKEFIKSDKVVIVGNFHSKDADEYKEFEKTAEKLRVDFLFGATFDKKADVAITLHKDFDEGKGVFDGDYKSDNIVTFIKNMATPLLGEISPDNYMTYIEHGLPIGYFFVENDEQRDDIRSKALALAKKHKGKINFVFIDALKFGAHANSMNLEEGKWPAFAIHKDASDEKFPFKKDLEQEDLEAFCDGVIEGTIKASLRSQPAPEDNNGPVKIVVGDTFKEIVQDESKDVFIEFYAPWCGHCKKLAPIWDELGEKLESQKDKIVIAKMDAADNDLPGGLPFKIEGFPTLKLFKAETNEVVDFDGERTLKAFLTFLEKNSDNFVPLKKEEKKKEEKKEEPKKEEKKEKPKKEEKKEEGKGKGKEKPHEEL